MSDTHTNVALTSGRYRLTDKEINEICNDCKGQVNQCYVYCETYFPGHVNIPITHILDGDSFYVFFETCVGNYWKRQEIMKWLLYVLPIPKNNSIMQRGIYILLRYVEMIAQLIVVAILFLSVIVPM